jgi:hypothetical protein
VPLITTTGFLINMKQAHNGMTWVYCMRCINPTRQTCLRPSKCYHIFPILFGAKFVQDQIPSTIPKKNLLIFDLVIVSLDKFKFNRKSEFCEKRKQLVALNYVLYFREVVNIQRIRGPLERRRLIH